MDAELFVLFGGYSEYMQAPAHVVLKHKLRLLGKWQAEQEIREKEK